MIKIDKNHALKKKLNQNFLYWKSFNEFFF